LDSLKLSVNVGTFIGHNNVRKAVLGEAAIAPDSIQLKKMEALVNKAMLDGAMGFSTGLIYTPGLYSKNRRDSGPGKSGGKI